MVVWSRSAGYFLASTSFAVSIKYSACHFIFNWLSVFNLKVGIIAALLMTFSVYQLQFAHEIRDYTFFSLWTILSMYCFLILLFVPISKQKSKGTLLIISWTIVNIILAYTNFFGLMVWFIQLVSFILFWKKSPNFDSIYNFKSQENHFLRQFHLKFLIGLGFTILGYLPYCVVFFSRAKDSAVKGTWIQAPTSLEPLYLILVNFSNQPVPTVIGIFILITTLVVIFVKKTNITYSYPEISKIFSLWFLIPWLGMYLLSFKVPMYLDRYLIHGNPAFYLLLAVSSDFLFQIWRNKTVPKEAESKIKLFLPYLPSIVLVLSYVFSFDLYKPNGYAYQKMVKIVNLPFSPKEGSQFENRKCLITSPSYTINGYLVARDLRKVIELKTSNEDLMNENIYAINVIEELHKPKIIQYDTIYWYQNPNTSTEIIKSFDSIYQSTFERQSEINVSPKITMILYVRRRN